MRTLLFTAAVAASVTAAAFSTGDGPFTKGTWDNGQYAQQTDGQMGIFPNPASDEVNVVYPGLEGKATLAIVAGDGRVMRRMDIGQTGAARTVVDISGLANGSYWVRITQPGGFDYARRLVVAQ